MTDNLKALLAKQEKAKKEAADLEAQINEVRAANSSAVVDQVVSLLEENGEFFSAVQRNRIKRLLGDDGPKAPRAQRRAGEKPEPKFQLDSGEAWAGRGRLSKAFDEWDKSGEAKKWREANPGQKFPAYPNKKVGQSKKREDSLDQK